MSKRIIISLIIIFGFHLFFRFFQLESYASLGWDQVDSAWAAKSIVVDHNFILQGPVAKGNTGIYMGPLYYYLISIVYYFTGMDPIASPIFAGLTATFNAVVVYWVTKKLFNRNVALIALFINTFSISVMHRDHIQNAIQFIVPVSYLIFYFLYRVITGCYRHLIHLGILVGLSFHVDFTSVFYPMLILFSLPFFPWEKKTIPYWAWSLVLFVILILPMFIAGGGAQSSLGGNFLSLFNTYFHGFHLRRILQLVHDAFINIESIVHFRMFRPFVFLLPPIFMAMYWNNKKRADTLKLYYLIGLWFVIPWLVLSTYKGELTTSYFSLPFNISIAMLSYLTWRMLRSPNKLLRVMPIIFWIWYAASSTQLFLRSNSGTMPQQRKKVLKSISKGQVIPFKHGHADSYLYYYYTQINDQRPK